MIKNCALANDYLNYLSVIKGRSKHTIQEYEVDLRMFFRFVCTVRELSDGKRIEDFSFVNLDLIKSISLMEMHAFVAYCKNERNDSTSTLIRKIVSIRQFWKYLKTKVRLIENNVAEELETPKRPKREPKYLTLDESMRLLLSAETSIRDYCILTIFLNCALRLSELISLNVAQIDSDGVLSVIGKGDKERKIFLPPSSKQAISRWLKERETYHPKCDALFVSKRGTRIAHRTVQEIVKKHMLASGINREGITPHKLRHTCATLLYKYGGCDVKGLQAILGHEDLATTSIYVHSDINQLQAMVNANPLAGMTIKR